MNSSKKLLDNTCSLLICHVGFCRIFFLPWSNKDVQFHQESRFNRLMEKVMFLYIILPFWVNPSPHVLIIERTAAFALRFDLAPPSSPCSGDYLTHPRVMFSTELIGVLQLGAVFETPDSSRVIRHPTIFPTKKSSVSPFSKNQNWKSKFFPKASLCLKCYGPSGVPKAISNGDLLQKH